MSQPVLLKAYGNLWPVAASALAELRPVLDACLPKPAADVANWRNDLLTISFEGIYFPVDETLGVLAALLTEQSQGKLDIIDLENWRLTRHIFQNGRIASRAASLNNVLDYSGY